MLDRWYHKHWRGWTVANIKAHDKFVIDTLSIWRKVDGSIDTRESKNERRLKVNKATTVL